ncbi:FtsX-like permease family protein [candidate division KSB1 bacterium]|nr:FtsX-like permease family protein [candidate division KSB1 bacterium]
MKKLAQLYHSEQRMSDLFKAFALLAIFISCLGLFGLSSYAAQVRVKEIGIRKTLGASLTDIVRLLSGKYLVWILIANAVALPVAYLYMQDWLRHFAYRAHIGGAPFIFTLALTLLVTLAATSYHALRAGTANPVKSLRYE